MPIDHGQFKLETLVNGNEGHGAGRKGTAFWETEDGPPESGVIVELRKLHENRGGGKGSVYATCEVERPKKVHNSF